MNKLVFILWKTGLDNWMIKLSDLIAVVGGGGTAIIKNDFNTTLCLHSYICKSHINLPFEAHTDPTVLVPCLGLMTFCLIQDLK